ncbi:hypothetical protein QBC36DRAFT_315950, partial [Triangularia setosa]
MSDYQESAAKGQATAKKQLLDMVSTRNDQFKDVALWLAQQSDDVLTAEERTQYGITYIPDINKKDSDAFYYLAACADKISRQAQESTKELQDTLDNFNNENQKWAARDEAQCKKIASLETEARVLRETSMPTTTARTVRFSDPEAFNGNDSSAVKRSTKFRTWKNAVWTRWTASPSEFATEYSKIAWASTKLGGPALGGVIHHIEIMHDHPDDPSYWKWLTAKGFLDALSLKYATVDLASAAELRLESLWQKG